jgi:4-amino-4-deoxy-L-arabinose transferase-like glycosyltransferase
MSRYQKGLLALVVVLAAALRLWCFIGYARGDDPIYALIAKRLVDEGLGFFTPETFQYGVNYRLGLYVPIAASFALLGIDDFTFVLYPLLASLGTIVVVCLIGAALFDAKVGLIAAVLVALSPFDTAFASTMVIDLVTSFLTAVALYGLVAGARSSGWRGDVVYASAAGALWVAYWVKEPVTFLLPGFLAIAALQVVRGVSPRGPLVFCGSLGLLAMLCLGFDWVLTGAPLNRFQVQMAQSGVATGPVRDTLLTYPRWLFHGSSEGMPLGYLSYLLLPALGYVGIFERRRAAVVLLWLLPLAALIEFMPMRLDPLVLSPRYERYLNALLAPAALVVAIPLGAVWHRSRLVVGALLIGVAVTSIRDAREQHRVWADGTSDVVHASRVLWGLPAKPVFSDGWLCQRYSFDGGLDPRRLEGRNCTDLLDGQKLTDIVARGDFEKLRALPPGYVVAGGSRAHYAMTSSVLHLEDHMIPPGWRLVLEIPNAPTSYRLQPLRIWEIAG